MKKIVCIIFVIIFISSFGILYLRSIDSDMCGITLVDEIANTTHSKKAVVFVVNCGATTDYSTQVSILNYDDIISDNLRGNIFISDTNHGEAPSFNSAGPEVLAEWIDNDNLIIRHHPKARIFKAENILDSITIEYDYLK